MGYNAIVKKLTDSVDFRLLVKEIFEGKLGHVSENDVVPNGFVMGSEFRQQEVNGDDITGSYHINLGGYNRIFFNSSDEDRLRKEFEALNALTTDFSFEFNHATSWDEEPGERTYPARIYFKITDKL